MGYPRPQDAGRITVKVIGQLHSKQFWSWHVSIKAHKAKSIREREERNEKSRRGQPVTRLDQSPKEATTWNVSRLVVTPS
jgi:hypothetical protein